jgi:hypothetical protein
MKTFCRFKIFLLVLGIPLFADANMPPVRTMTHEGDVHAWACKHEVLDTLILRVEDYGASGDGLTDDGPMMRNVFEKASGSTGPVKIVFKPGAVYYIGPYEHAHGRLMLIRANNVLVEGNHCLIMAHPSNRTFGVYRSKNITIRNFSIDYSPLPFTQGRITKIENQRGYLEFKVDDGYPIPKIADSTYYVDGRLSDCVTINGEDLKFFQGHSRISGVTDLGNRTFGVTYRMRRQHQARIGDYFAMKVKYPAGSDLINRETNILSEKNEYISTGGSSISAIHTAGLLIENIISYASPEMTLNTRSCSGQVIRGLLIKRKPGRVIAGCSDGIHMKGNENQPLIEDCYFEGTMDDSIHIKISGDIITDMASARKVRIRHMDITTDNTNLGIGKTVMVYDPDKQKQLAMITISDIEFIDYRNAWVTFDQDVTGIKLGDCLYLQAENEAVIQNCRFGTQLQRAILTHQPTTIRNCTIVDNGKGLDQSLSTRGIEGPPSQRVIVENCIFENLSYVALDVRCPSKDYDQLGKPQLIVKNSIFNLPDGVPLLRIMNSNGVEFTGNKFGYLNKKPLESEYFQMTNSDFTKFSGNTFHEGWVSWGSDSE